jgi:hypothetical protein
MQSTLRLYKLIAAAIFFSTLIAGVAIYRKYGYYTVWLSTTSPNQRYTVELTGDKGRGGILIPSVVRSNILIGGERVVSDRYVHSGDAMDISFELAYPKHAWVNESTLQFWSDRHRREDNLDVLLITNNTQKVIRYLQIKTWDLIFVFDVQPQSQVKLLFTHRTEGKTIYFEGKFDDGARVEYSASFPEYKNQEPQKYCTTIEYDRTTVYAC